MITKNKTQRFDNTYLRSARSRVTLLEILVIQNAAKWYVVRNPETKNRFIVTLVGIGGEQVIPVGTDGRIFGGACPELWDRFEVVDALETFISFYSSHDANI